MRPTMLGMGTPKDNDGREKMRAVRIPDDLWLPAQERARSRDESLARVIRRALRKYIAGELDDA